mgnify:CR=1 FL=1
MSFSELLKQCRKKQGVSQAELASKLGVTQQAVGKWESGKSSPDPTTVARIAELLNTTADYLLGLYRPQQGQVMLNGVEAATLPDTARRPLVGYVEQSFRRVPGTVRDQITLFDAAITPQQAEDAARTVGLHDAIAALPEGYDTPCTPGIFSQGQWQLLSIARAIAAGPQILLLDEITANLDAGTEQTVLDALQRAGQNRTVVSISHRLYNRTGGRSIAI